MAGEYSTNPNAETDEERRARLAQEAEDRRQENMSATEKAQEAATGIHETVTDADTYDLEGTSGEFFTGKIGVTKGEEVKEWVLNSTPLGGPDDIIAPTIARPDASVAAAISGDYGYKEVTDADGNVTWEPKTATEYFDTQGRLAQEREAAQIEQGAQVADTTMGDASAVDALALQARDAQSSLVSSLQNRAAGQAPSVAQLQLQRSRDANIRAAQAQAAGQVGVSAGQAARMALQQAGAANQEAAGQAAVLRAQEMTQAEQNLATTLQGQRGQDIQASQQMQERLLSEFKIDANSAIAQAGFDTQTLIANLQSEQGQRAMNDKMTQYYMDQGFSRDEANRQALIDMERIKAEIETAQAKIKAEIEKANLAAESKERDRWFGLAGQGAGAVGTFLGSDVNMKENISTGPSDDNKVQSFLDSLEASGWEYKDPERHGKGRKYGVMAQDLEQSEVGNTMVEDKPEGKGINVVKGFGPVLAALSHLNEKQKKLEEMISRSIKRGA